jgi:carbon monoxide dehydrogenase subunit G
MQINATEDVDAPIAAVWAHVSDVDAFEERAAARMSGLARHPSGPAGEGTVWTGGTEVMGRRRAVTVAIRRMDAPAALDLDGGAEGLDVRLAVRLEALGAERTRLTVMVDATARSLGGRVMLQSLKLVRDRIERRFAEQVAGLADRIVARGGAI